MWHRFLDQVADLLARDERFVVATVVRCEAPTSGKPGDKAIITADGALRGWIGGGCAQPVVIAEAKKALVDGRPRVVRISPTSDRVEEGVVDYPMTCHSGGAMDIYVEPVLPKPYMVILGRSPVAQALARLGTAIDYAVTVVMAEADSENFAGLDIIVRSNFGLDILKVTPDTFVVVSTQGEGDEEALEQAVKSDAGYVGFVASKTKADKVFAFLRGKGIGEERLNQVHAPAGLDLGARSPEEIALSVLAQIIQFRSQRRSSVSQVAHPPTVVQTKDPICGMTVDPGKAKYQSEHNGVVFYFCCAGCKESFDQQPEMFAVANR